MFRHCFALACLAAAMSTDGALAAPGERTPDFAGVIDNVSRILELPEAEARREVPVHLAGVVLGEAPPIGRGFVLWDGSASIYIRDESPVPGSCIRGREIELDGVTNAGGFTPSVTMTAVRHLGTAPLPAPRPVTGDELLSGRCDAEWVRLRGIVRSCEAATVWAGRWRLMLASAGQVFTVHVSDDLEPERLIDAEVTIDGLVFNQHNMSRQSVRPLLFIPSGVPVAIDVAPPVDPFAGPVRPVAQLLQFDRNSRPGHRAHVRGTVIHQRPGTALWIRDGERGLFVSTGQAGDLQPGDIVDVLGFPAQGAYSPRLEHAVFRKTGETGNPAPASPTDIRSASAHDSDLISLEGEIVDTRRTASALRLELDWQGARIPASYPLPEEQPVPPSWLVGSRIRATGICTVPDTEPGRASGTWEPASFELQLRDIADVQVLRPAPWWTTRRILQVLGATTGVLLLSIAAVVMIARRRLQDQAIRRARAEAEFSAILAERNRVAREIHDTLAQGLAAISMRLELARNARPGTNADNNIAEAHRLAKETLAEARATIWNMRSLIVERHGLAGALEAILHQLAEGTKLKTGFTEAGRRVPLAPVVESELLRIGQEAIANAVKHAAAQFVAVALTYNERQLELSVTDDGCGFEPERSMAASGHFGLLGIRERAAQISARLQVTSRPGRGTSLTVTIPLPPA